MNLTSLGEKEETRLLAQIEKIAQRVASKTGEDVWHVKSSIAFLLDHQKDRHDTLCEESMQRAHDAVYGEGR